MRLYYGDMGLARRLSDIVRDAAAWLDALKLCEAEIIAAGYTPNAEVMDGLEEDFWSCNTFWNEKVSMYGRKVHGGELVVVGTTAYFLHTDQPITTNRYFRGHGGATFKIRFLDGRVVTTNDLWCNGDIPKRFQDRLKPNAEFLPV